MFTWNDFEEGFSWKFILSKPKLKKYFRNERCTVLFNYIIIQILKVPTKVTLPEISISIALDSTFFCVDWLTFFSDHLSRILLSHHITFLWGPLPMLPPNWLSFGPYGKMYCLNVQCNACTFSSLFVWLSILFKPKLKIYLREIIKRRGKAPSFTLNCLFVYIK